MELNIETLKNSGYIIMEAITGSTSFGLNTAESDIDKHGVFILPLEERLKYNPIDEIKDEKNDCVYWEIKKYLQLLAKANPGALELLYSPKEFILQKNPIFDLIPKVDFLTIQCKDTFIQYASNQIKRAYGLNKKVFNPKIIKPTVLDFCYIWNGKTSEKIKEYLKTQQIKDQKFYAISSIDKMENMYNLYFQNDIGESERWAYGIVRDEEKSDDIQLCSIPKNITSIGIMSFNKNAYSKECKEYAQYLDWVNKRNDARYEKTIEHGKGYDSKNMMHNYRLLLTAKEIAEKKTLIVNRTKDREFLFKIKNGEFEFDELVKMSNNLINEIEILFKNTNLPKTCPDINDLLIKILFAKYKGNL